MIPKFEEVLVDEPAITAIETFMGLSLPSDYRTFLLLGKGGKPEPETWGSAPREYDFIEFFRPSQLVRQTDRADREIGRLMIAECLTGDHFALDLNEGAVYFHKYEHPVDDVDGAYRRVSPSFTEFLDGFHEPTDY